MQAFFNGGEMDRLYSLLETKFRPENGYRLHFATAWEMYEAVRRLCGAGETPAGVRS